MKLSKLAIKKFGISKKAWSWQRSHNKGSARIKTKVVSVARRKAKKSYARKGKSHKKSGLFGGVGKLLGAAVYGAGREYMSNAIQPLTSKIPAGNISDEVGMIAALWAGKRFLGRRVPLINDVANAGMMIEAARIGATVANGQLGGFGQGGASSSGMQIVG